MLGLLLVNLGSPKSPSPQDVEQYLKQFLNDPYVIDWPAPLRWLLVNGIILQTRPKKSAEAYAKIWMDVGSPLIHYTQRLADKVRQRVSIPVEVGMRYGQPSLKSAIDRLLAQGVTEIVLFLLYPQYSYAASETAIVEVERILPPTISLRVIEHFHQHPNYVAALAESIAPTLQSEKPDLLLLSYHGIPNQQRFKTRNQRDYREHCYETSQAMQKKLDFPADRIETSFQSRLGPTQWIEPYTDYVLPELVARGIKRIAVASPSFTADCLETLEEINLRYRQLFLDAGGESFTYIPCLNDSDPFADAVVTIARDYIPNGKSL